MKKGITEATPYLKIIKSTSRDVIIKLPHYIPRTISNPNQNYWQRKFTAIKQAGKYVAQKPNSSKLLKICHCYISQLGCIPCSHNCINCLLFLWAKLTMLCINTSCNLTKWTISVITQLLEQKPEGICHLFKKIV